MLQNIEGTIIVFMIVYLAVLLGIGVYTTKYMKTLEDYLLAGRSLGPWVLAFTYSATGMSGWLGLGFAGYTYETGFEGVWTMVPSATIGILLCFTVVSQVIRRYSLKANALTVPDVLEHRYYDKSRIIRLVSAIIIFAAAIAYVNGQLVATGKVFSTLLGWDYTYSIVISGVVFMVYTMLGGFLAVCWTEMIQGTLMVIGSLLAGFFALSFSGGLGELSVNLAAIPPIDPKFVLTPFASLPVIIFGITLFLGDGIFSWLGQPTLMVRYMAAKSTRTLRITALIAVFIQSILFYGIFLAALAMRAKFPTPDLLPRGGDMETVIIQFFTIAAHPIFAGIFLGGLLAAIMSTAASLLISGTSTIVNDIYSRIINPNASQEKLVFMSRVVTAIIGCLGLALSLRGGSVLWISWFGWNTLGLFAAPVILGLWWPRATREGAIAGLVGGFLTMLLWDKLGLNQYIFQAFAAGVVAFFFTVIVSLLTKEPPQEIQDAVRSIHFKNQIKDYSSGSVLDNKVS